MNNAPGFVGNRMNFPRGRFPTPFENFRGPPGQQPSAMAEGLGHYFDRVHNTDPDVILNQVIPVIIRQAQENLSSGRLEPNQFSELMRQVMQMKEQAMMLQADKMHRNQAGPGGNWGPSNQPPQKLPIVPGPLPPAPPMFPGKPEMLPPPAQPKPPPFVNRDLPMAGVEELELIASDPVSTIDIDLQSRVIRFYGEMATVVLAPGDVREISFSTTGLDPSRFVIIDDKLKIKLPIKSANYVPFVLNGVEHSMKLGAPTRELWINGKFHQCLFNQAIRVQVSIQ
jgi:hypothetical protein